jgi:hypothetical protein
MNENRMMGSYLNIFRVAVITIAILLGFETAGAQVSLTVDAPRVVETGETFKLVYMVNAPPDSFTPPAITNFEILAGPTSSTMSSTQIVNGRRTESFQVSYTYILTSAKEGQFTIPAASVTVEGKNHTSAPITIEVVKGDETSSQKNPEGVSISNEDIFLKLSVSKSRVVTGEHLIATIKLYTRVPVSGFEDIKFPSFNGFWSQEIDSPQNIEFVRESVNGKIYDAALLRRYMLLPQQSGTISIDGAEIVCQIRIRAGSNAPRSIFDDFFDSYQTIRKRVTASPVRIVADPLPAGAPASFSGGVGSFFINSRLTRDSVSANEALSYIIEVSGTGNINLIESPKPEIPTSFEVYDTKITDNSSRGANGASGSKQFEFPLIARAPGEYTIPSLQFSYYDVSRKQYVTLSTNEHNIKVGNSSISTPGTGITLSTGVNQQAVRSISDDIRYIVTGSAPLRKGNLFLFGSAGYLIYLLVLVVLFVVAEKFLSRRIERSRDIAGTRNRKANKVARLRLKNAGLLLKSGEYSPFYQELHKALLGYVSDKLNLTLSDISRDKIMELLHTRGVNQDLIQELLFLIDQCEFARYSPNPGGTGMEDNYKKAMELISSMEL